MTRTTTAPAKTCVLCRQDCSSRPRVKDPGGRYYCKLCYEQARRRQLERRAAASTRARQRRVEPQQTPPQVPRRPSRPHVRQAGRRVFVACPSCGKPWPLPTVICTVCGCNMQRAYDAGVAAVRHADRPPLALGGEGVMAVITSIALLAAFASVPIYWGHNEPVVFVALGAWVLLSLMLWAATAWTAFHRSLLDGLLSAIIMPYSIYFAFFRSRSASLKLLYGATILCGLPLLMMPGKIRLPELW